MNTRTTNDTNGATVTVKHSGDDDDDDSPNNNGPTVEPTIVGETSAGVIVSAGIHVVDAPTVPVISTDPVSLREALGRLERNQYDKRVRPRRSDDMRTMMEYAIQQKVVEFNVIGGDKTSLEKKEAFAKSPTIRTAMIRLAMYECCRLFLEEWDLRMDHSFDSAFGMQLVNVIREKHMTIGGYDVENVKSSNGKVRGIYLTDYGKQLESQVDRNLHQSGIVALKRRREAESKGLVPPGTTGSRMPSSYPVPVHFYRKSGVTSPMFGVMQVMCPGVNGMIEIEVEKSRFRVQLRPSVNDVKTEMLFPLDHQQTSSYRMVVDRTVGTPTRMEHRTFFVAFPPNFDTTQNIQTGSNVMGIYAVFNYQQSGPFNSDTATNLVVTVNADNSSQGTDSTPHDSPQRKRQKPST